ncbi:MAG: hypothetical protein KatS3mg035_0800 [Bacteroidia bacterium]|nr:MAG: hypothetical protein KatS3mg035_0800 [Bacteroidia bacterium]
MKKYLSILILILLIACGGSKKESSANEEQPIENPSNDGKGKGCNISKDEFKKAKIFEPLSEAELPSSVSLLDYAPERKSQGRQGSCVGWSSSYAARTILQAATFGDDPNQIAFSPSFVYNQIKVAGCDRGSYINDAMDLLTQIGDVPLSDFGYDESTCSAIPDKQLKQKASNYRILGYNRLTTGQTFDINYEAMKQNLAQGAPVVVALPVGGSFENMWGKEFWRPNEYDYEQLEMYKNGYGGTFGGHAMCVIGYDNNKGVQIMNSWGKEFGKDGIFWMSEKDFKAFCMEAYGLFPFPREKKETQGLDFSAEIGFKINKTNDFIPLQKTSEYTFSSISKIAKKTKFKISVKNDMACYVYVIGQEVDGSSYILFPYTKDHSPYCGITGTRVFPADYSLMVDDIGTKDVMCVILSKKELDIHAINDDINNNRNGDYEKRVKKALGKELISTEFLNSQADSKVKVQVKDTPANAIPFFIEINK